MGKIVTIYLSDDEARDLKEFCDESRSTQYSVLKTAVRQLLYKPIQVDEDGPQEIEEKPEETLEEPIEENIIVEEAPEELHEKHEKETPTTDSLLPFLRLLRKESNTR